MSHRRSRTASPTREFSCLNWHLSGEEAAQLSSARIDDVPTKEDLVTTDEVPLDVNEAGEVSTRLGPSTTVDKINAGAVLAEHLLSLKRSVAFLLLEEQERRWTSDHESEVGTVCWEVLRTNLKKQLEFEAYEAGLRQRRAGSKGVSVMKPLYCRDKVVAKNLIGLLSERPNARRPLMRLLSGDLPLARSLAKEIVENASATLPLLPNDHPLALSRQLTLACIGWDHLSSWELVYALAFAHQHRLEDPATDPALLATVAEIQERYEQLRGVVAEERRQDAARKAEHRDEAKRLRKERDVARKHRRLVEEAAQGDRHQSEPGSVHYPLARAGQSGLGKRAHPPQSRSSEEREQQERETRHPYLSHFKH